VRLEQNGYNPLKELLTLMPAELELLTPLNMRQYANTLILGGVTCETMQEVHDALVVLAELEVLVLISNEDGTISVKRNLNVS
jgi:hypothetical protein